MSHRTRLAPLALRFLALAPLGLAGCGDIPAEPEKQTQVQKVEKGAEDLGQKAVDGAKDLGHKAVEEGKDLGKKAGDKITELEDKAGKAMENGGKKLQDNAAKKD